MKKIALNKLGTNPSYDNFIETWRQLRVHKLRHGPSLGHCQVWVSNSAFMESTLWSRKRSMEIGGGCEFLLERQLMWVRKLYCQEPMAALILYKVKHRMLHGKS